MIGFFRLCVVQFSAARYCIKTDDDTCVPHCSAARAHTDHIRTTTPLSLAVSGGCLVGVSSGCPTPHKGLSQL